MKLIKNFEIEFKKLIDDNKGFLQFLNDFGNNLTENSNSKQELSEKRLKLINLLAKYPKRKILFDFAIDETDYKGNKKTIKVGVNKGGLGIIKWGHNIENTNNYYAKNLFINLLKSQKFKDKLLKTFQKKNKKEFIKVIKDIDSDEIIESNSSSYNSSIKPISLKIPKTDLLINIETNGISFNICHKTNNNNNTYENQILNEGDIRNLSKTKLKRANGDKFKEVSEYELNLNFDEIMGLLKVLPHKEKIKQVIKEHLKSKKEHHRKIEKKLKNIIKLLSPYEALEKI